LPDQGNGDSIEPSIIELSIPDLAIQQPASPSVFFNYQAKIINYQSKGSSAPVKSGPRPVFFLFFSQKLKKSFSCA